MYASGYRWLLLADMSLSNQFYSYIADEEDARVCTDISDESCREVAGNFFLILVSGTLSKLGDELCNAKTVLPWLLNLVQAPAFLVSLLVPIRESGSLLPQLFIAGFIRKLAIRKTVWAAGSLIQGLSVVMMAGAAFFLTGGPAGFTIIGLLIVFSLARGLCSVAHKDVIGKTIPKTRRGRLGGLSASVAGVVALAVGLFFLFGEFNQSSIFLVSGLLVVAAASWIAAAAVFLVIREFKGATDGGANAIRSAVESFDLLKTDPQFGLFVSVRSLLLCSALTAPLLVQLATRSMGSTVQILGMFLVANSLASIVSGPLWGVFADRSSRKVMIVSVVLASIVGFMAVLFSVTVDTANRGSIAFPVAFFLLGIAHNGVRLGRKTYLVDMATGNLRTSYVAVSNTVIGGMLLLVGLAIGAISTFSIEAALVVLAVAGLTGAFLGGRLKEI